MKLQSGQLLLLSISYYPPLDLHFYWHGLMSNKYWNGEGRGIETKECFYCLIKRKVLISKVTHVKFFFNVFAANCMELVFLQ